MPRELLHTRRGRAVAGAVAALVVAVLAGLAVLWPSGDAPSITTALVGEVRQGEVRSVERFPCPLSRRVPCQRLQVQLEDGPDAGELVPLTMPGEDASARFEPGDSIRVVANDPTGLGTQADPLTLEESGLEPYAFADFERRAPLYLLAGLFAALVLVLGRRKGLLSLVGLVVSLGVVTQFMVPAILDGGAPLPVALVGSLAVMLLTIGLTHGAGPKSLAAVLGSSASLLFTALLALLFVELASITGFSSEEVSLLRSSGPETATLSPEGLVLAGIVVAALGVLDDVTISQSSTVMALQRANPAQRYAELFRGALSVGRDHLSATVNTLVFAYVGAALPVLLIFENQNTGFGDALNREPVAEQVVGMLVGSIGLILAVPLTTALAAMLARLLPPAALGDEHAGHVH